MSEGLDGLEERSFPAGDRLRSDAGPSLNESVNDARFAPPRCLVQSGAAVGFGGSIYIHPVPDELIDHFGMANTGCDA